MKDEIVQSEPRKLEKPARGDEMEREEIVTYANESGDGCELEVTTVP